MTNEEKTGFRLADCVWMLDESGHDARNTWLRGQIETLVKKLCGTPPAFTTRTGGRLCIAVGTPTSHSAIKQADEQGLIDMKSFGPDDYILKNVLLNGVDVLILGGRTRNAAMYAVFACFERLGCTFLFSRDQVPSSNPDLKIPLLDEKAATACSMRGIGFGAISCWPTNFMMSVSDHEAMLDQMAKMRLNTMLHWHFEQDPFVDYSFKGERKLIGDIAHPDSGYVNYGRHFVGSFLVKDIPYGRGAFDRRKIACPELQNVSTSEEALDAAGEMMRALMKRGKERGIKTWMCVYPQFTTPNFSKYTRRMPRTHLHWSAHLSCTDPAVAELNRARIQGILDAYPDIDGICFGIPEGFYNDPYPESEALIHREWPHYADALTLMKAHWGKFWKGEELQEAHLRADIAFVEILKNTIATAKDLKPDIKLSVHTVCKAYLLPYLDTILPKDVSFIDIESKALWTVDGAPLHIFQRIKNRECAIMPRAVDDGSLVGLQYPFWQYEADGFLTSSLKNGTSGLITQVTHVRGNEHTLKYIADGMWKPDLTPAEFYRDYAHRIFGRETVPRMLEAFAIMEETDQRLGGRGQGNMCWNMLPAQVSVLQSFKEFNEPFYKAPFNRGFVDMCQAKADLFQTAVDSLERAIDVLEEASALATDSGKKELAYMIRRTKGYRGHLQTLIGMANIYADYLKVFDLLEDLECFKTSFAALVSDAKQLEKRVEEAAGYLASNVEHTSDLGILWAVGNRMGLGTRCLRQYLENILAFYEGREYWNKVDWDILFGISPFPASSTAAPRNPKKPGEYEPG